MEAEDLRAGNLVDINGVSTIVLPYGINSRFYLDTAKPIPLTQDWIERMDYENITELASDLSYAASSYLPYNVNFNTDEGIEFLEKMAIHELQNFWKENTGQELTINKEK